MVGYIFIIMMYVDFISSPYLLVFGDDRVRGTHEQRMLMQVVPVTLKSMRPFWIIQVFCNLGFGIKY